MALQTYRSKMRIAVALALAAAVAAGFVGGRVARAGEPGEHFWLVYPALLAVCALAFAATVPWWRKLDDMQKHWHLVSWYWGGMAGGLAVTMALVAATGVHSDLSKGSLYTLMGQAVAFLVFFAGWSLRHRGPEA
jgi:hypothetical protein